MNWQNFRQAKGQSVQSQTQGFIKTSLILGVNLTSQDTILKYMGGLHSYLRHTILMFNPTIQATHLESSYKNVPQGSSKKPFKSGDKGKGKAKGKRRVIQSRKRERTLQKMFKIWS